MQQQAEEAQENQSPPSLVMIDKQASAEEDEEEEEAASATEAAPSTNNSEATSDTKVHTNDAVDSSVKTTESSSSSGQTTPRQQVITEQETDLRVLAVLNYYHAAKGPSLTIPERPNKRKLFIEARKFGLVFPRPHVHTAIVTAVFVVGQTLVIRLDNQQMRTLLDYQAEFYSVLVMIASGMQLCANCGELTTLQHNMTELYHGRGRCGPDWGEKMEILSGYRFHPLFGLEVSFLNQKVCLPVCTQRDAIVLRDNWTDFVACLEPYAEPAQTVFYLTIQANYLTEGDHKFFESLDSGPACYIGRTVAVPKAVRSLSSDSAYSSTEKFTNPQFEFRIDTSRFKNYDRQNLRRLYAGYHMEDMHPWKK